MTTPADALTNINIGEQLQTELLSLSAAELTDLRDRCLRYSSMCPFLLELADVIDGVLQIQDMQTAPIAFCFAPTNDRFVIHLLLWLASLPTEFAGVKDVFCERVVDNLCNDAKIP